MPKLFHLVLNPKAIEYYQDILDYLRNRAGFRYILVTKHLAHPGQNYDHYHIAVQYKHSILLDAAKLHGAHNEPAEKSIQANIKYCKCEDKKHKELGVTYELIHEEGEYKPRGGDYSVKHLLEINNKLDLPDARLYNVWKKIKYDDTVDIDIEDWGKTVKVYWIQGESGVGKTNMAKQIVRDNKHIFGSKFNRVKYENGFWSGIGSAKIAIYDDFRDGHMKPSEFINFIDYNKHYMNIKGGSVLNNYELIIITTVQKLERIYGNVDGEPRQQWTRRINVIDMYDNNDSLIVNQSRDYERDDECYYCNNNIFCNCKCIENKRTCIEHKCNFFNKD